MLRKLLAAIAALGALGASACTYGSAVDIAPFKDRMAQPPLPAGYYCGAKGAQGAYVITTNDDCGLIKWDGATRTYIIIDDDKSKKPEAVAVVALSNGLYAAQTEAKDLDDQAAKLAPYRISLIIASGKAFTAVSSLDGDDLEAALKRHPKLKVARIGKDPYIAAGDVGEIKAFFRDVAGAALKQAGDKGEEMSVVVLDRRGKAEHPASLAQVKDIEAVKAIAEKLTPK